MISIIMPVYNAELFIQSTLQTVLAQTCPDWELIIVDDGCKDNTRTLVQGFMAQDSRIRLVTQPNAGCAAARNTGLQQISPSANYVIFLDHDDLWEPDALETLLATSHARPDAAAIIGGVQSLPDAEAGKVFDRLQHKAAQLHNGDLSEADVSPPVLGTLTFAETAQFCSAITMGQVLIRRDVMDATGSLNLDCVPSDDWELYLRLSLHGPLVTSNKQVIYWRVHANNTSKNTRRMYKAEMRVRASLLARPDVTPEQRKLIRDGFRTARNCLATKQRGQALECVKQGDFSQALKQLRYSLVNYARARGPIA